MLGRGYEFDRIYDFIERNVLGVFHLNVTLRVGKSIRCEHEPSLLPSLPFGAKLHQVTINDNMIGI